MKLHIAWAGYAMAGQRTDGGHTSSMRDIGPRLYHLENLDLWARIHPFRLALASGVGDIGARLTVLEFLYDPWLHL